MIRLLFVGESWFGSFARSLREALAALPDLYLDDIGEDLYVPKGRSPVIRASNRLLRRWYRAELAREIDGRITMLKPDALLVYKGSQVSAMSVERARTRGVLTVNVFPDQSPHAHGKSLREAMGVYDLVVSTKPFHPEHWRDTYGYGNRCVFVPHGYDPKAHYWAEPPAKQDLDVVMIAQWRPEYERLMVELAALIGNEGISVALAGNDWSKCRDRFPVTWQFPGGLHGRAYGEFLRRGRIVIAPVHTEVVIDGARQPGDEDTTRTYELAAAGCFFLHRRTPYARTVYDEVREVPMWDDAAELAALIRHYLPMECERREMAAAAHRRAVPAYSIPSRAVSVLEHIRGALAQRNERHKHQPRLEGIARE